MSKAVKEGERYQRAKDAFESLALDGWQIDEAFSGDGGQATVVGLIHNDGSKGVFRLLNKDDDKSRARFAREVEILTDTRFQHKNVVKILAHGQDTNLSWYISERGSDFRTFWKKKRKEFAENPDGLVTLAVQFIKELCQGLSALHKAGVVHRDIKPDNLVIRGEGDETYPVLIDFGVTYAEIGDERLTNVDDPVGNARFSPDVQMNWQEDVRPWLDIFQLSQLLIWMVQINPTKTWSRPLHWKWVNYRPELAKEIAVSLRAVTAKCSNDDTIPQNADELGNLIDNMFPEKNLDDKNATIDIERIRSNIASGKAGEIAREARDREAIDASYEEAKRFYEQLKAELMHTTSQLRESVPNCKLDEIAFEDFYSKILDRRQIGENLWTLRFEGGGGFFAVTINSEVHPPSRMEGRNFPEDINIFTFAISRHGSYGGLGGRRLKVTIGRDGNLFIRDNAMNPVEKIRIPKLVEIVKGFIEDPEPWKSIQNPGWPS